MTRKEYLSSDDKDSFRKYYSQFVSPSLPDHIAKQIGADRLLKSTDPHLNDIPLRDWDLTHMGPVDAAMREQGDYLTKAGHVCIAKEAARQWIEREK